MKWKGCVVCLTLCVIVVISGCVSISRADRRFLREIENVGLDTRAAAVKSPAAAACLNLLPGIGNFYLAAGTEEGSQWVFGILNLLLWPVSIIWGIPEAAIDAGTINKKETIYYYRFDERGRAELRAAKERFRQ